jgi:hypothetical protein
VRRRRRPSRGVCARCALPGAIARSGPSAEAMRRTKQRAPPRLAGRLDQAAPVRHARLRHARLRNARLRHARLRHAWLLDDKSSTVYS